MSQKKPAFQQGRCRSATAATARPDRRFTRGAGRGFTLTEPLVVIAITSVLMFLLFIPLSRSLDLSQRGRAKVQGQDSVRAAMRRITRDLANAMVVFPPRDIQVWGFTQWTNPRNRPRPTPTAVPEPYLLRNGLVAFRLPKHRFYCRVSEVNSQLPDHYVTPQDIDAVAPGRDPRFDDAVALDTCPRHPTAEVELRPQQPLEPDDRVTAYFIGLKNPALRAANRPLYQNLLLFQNTTDNFLNTYVLYRVEFDPTQPQFSNFGQPDFFYDPTPVRDPVSGQTKPFYQWWKDITVSVMDPEASDVIRWVETVGTGKYVPRSLVSFNLTPFEEDVAQPNRSVGQYAFSGGELPTDLPPLEYSAQYGNWLLTSGLPAGFALDGSAPLPDGALLANTTGPGVVHGPRIQVFGITVPQAGGGGTLQPVFDSAANSPRSRLVGFDPLTGRVTLSLPRRRTRSLDSAEANEEGRYSTRIYRDSFSASIDLTDYTVHLADDPLTPQTEGDREVDINTGMPTSFGAARARQQAIQANSANVEDFTLITPGSDSVQLVDVTGAVLAAEPLRRAGWTGLGRADQPVAQGDLEVDEYAIDYRTGIITLSDRRPEIWSAVGPAASGFPRHLLVRYKFQTNRSTDVVKVSYSTRELASVNIGVAQYTRRRAEVLPFEVSERVVVRNLRR